MCLAIAMHALHDCHLCECMSDEDVTPCFLSVRQQKQPWAGISLLTAYMNAAYPGVIRYVISMHGIVHNQTQLSKLRVMRASLS